MAGANGNGAAMARKPLLIVQSKVISNLLGLVGLIVILHYYNREVYGTITFTLALLGAFNAVADLGFSSAHIRHLNRGEDEASCNGTFIAIKLALTGIMVASVFGFLGIYTAVLGNILYDTTSTMILLFTLYYVFLDLVSIGTVTFNARRQTAKTQITLLLDPLIRVPTLAILATSRPSPTVLTLAYVAGGAASVCLALLLLSKQRVAPPSRRLFRSYLAFAFPLFPVGPSNTIAHHVDKLLLGIFWTSKEVGSYAAVEVVVSTLAILHIAFNTVAFPLFTRLEAKGSKKEIARILHKGERYLIAVLFPAVVVLILFPKTTLVAVGLYTGDAVLRVYAFAFAIYALGMIYFPLIPAGGRTDLVRKASVSYVVIFAALCALMIPTEFGSLPGLGLGAVGAAWALVVTNVFNTVAIRYLAWRVTGISSNPRILLHVAAALITAAALLFISLFVAILGVLPLLAVAAFALGIQALILYLMRELGLRDFREIWESVHPGLMTRYVASEFRQERH